MARQRKLETTSCACRDTGWIELNNMWERCPDHFKGQLHPETYNLLADEPARLADEEKKSKLQFQINQYRTRIDKLQLQLKTYQEKVTKLESELINRTATVRAMAAVRLDDPELEIDETDMSWEDLDIED